MTSSVHADFRSLDRARGNALLGIESQQWQVQEDCKPVAVDHEEEGKEGVDTGFGDNVGVESVAQVDGVDVVAATGKISEEPLGSPRELSQARCARYSSEDGSLHIRDKMVHTTRDHCT